MNVKLGQAVKMFFGNSSLEMVYFEAVANAFDADASHISIEINAQSYANTDTLTIKISDDGVGFTNERFKKFSRLFDVEEKTHKGVGRLVYLCYFNEVGVISHFDKSKKREFIFNENFNGKSKVTDCPESVKNGTELSLIGYSLSKIRQHSYIQPHHIKQKLLNEFYSLLFKKHQHKTSFEISIKATIEDIQYTATITNADIPEFKIARLDNAISIAGKASVYYSIQQTEFPEETSFLAALAVDNRTIKIDMLSDENIPHSYKMIFLLYSDSFEGRVDASRQNLTLSEGEKLNVQALFRQKISQIIEEELPEIKQRNATTRKNLENRYPHLSGFFPKASIGYDSRNEVLKKAQEHFFRAQRELLEASTLTDEQYQKSLDLSARALTEYILFRQITIEKLKHSSKSDTEADLHNLFVGMRTKYDQQDLAQDLYRNNAWLLDDKYMTYEAVFSDKEMGDLVQHITEGEVTDRDIDRPDIAIVFSKDPDKAPMFDVVIVELKRRGISVEKNMTAIIQLQTRARKLMKYFNNKIQRIWFYAIVEFNDELELQLSGEYKELYSSGKMYYRETNVAIQKNPDIVLPIGVYVWDLDAVVQDADARNSSFLKLIKSKFKND